MLDPWIIEEILRREEERQREQEQGRLELPLESPRYREGESKPISHEEDSGRGVVVIDI
ncbi:MAG: hypothetical protein MJE77_31500 [Proteobacteria bacterium]|nr:hypothetical protein [Pseudomonadota bacterium]